MNSKTLLLCLVILALVSFSAQSLTIKRSHTKEKHMAKMFANNFEHNMFAALHVEADAQAGPNSDFMMEFASFIAGDE